MQLAILTNCTSPELLKMYIVYPQGNGDMNIVGKKRTNTQIE